jgi:methylenetetrahydrofolate reductase (NADPH)
MIRRLVEEGGLRGFHLCTLNLEKSVRSILENLGWTPGHAIPHTRLIAVSFSWLYGGAQGLYVDKESVGPAEQPTTTIPDLITTPAGATSSAANGLTSHVTSEGGTGRGEVNYADTWDEFPNGRFGDANSPAFGSQDLWGGYGRIVSARCF